MKCIIGILWLLALAGCKQQVIGGDMPIEEVNGAVTITNPAQVTACTVGIAAPALEVDGQPLGRNPYGVIWGNNDGMAYTVQASSATAPPETWAIKWGPVLGDPARWTTDWITSGFKGWFTAAPSIRGQPITMGADVYFHTGCIGVFANNDQFEVIYDTHSNNTTHNHFWLPLPFTDLPHSPGPLFLWGGQVQFSPSIADPLGPDGGFRTAIHVAANGAEVVEGGQTCPGNIIQVYHWDQKPGALQGSTRLRITTNTHQYVSAMGTVAFCLAPPLPVSSTPWTDVYMAMTREDGAAFWLRPTEITRDVGPNNVKDWASSTNQIVAIWPTINSGPTGSMVNGDNIAAHVNGLEGLSADGSTFYHLELLTNSTSSPAGTAALQNLWWASMAPEATVHNPVSTGP